MEDAAEAPLASPPGTPASPPSVSPPASLPSVPQVC